MLLLVTGASGAGKSTARRHAAAMLPRTVECAELGDVLAVPAMPTIAWRQRAAEAAVQRAVAMQTSARHLLLSGDPVAAGEIVAAPSADRLDAIAVCLLDVDRASQAARLRERGDDPRLLADHQAFAAWMRAHARDPGHMMHALTTGGWEAMRWGRLDDLDPVIGGWAMYVLDTSSLSSAAVAEEVVAWCREALAGRAPRMRVVSPSTAAHPGPPL